MKSLKNMKIATRLVSCFIIITLIAVIVGVVGVYNINNIQANDKQLYNEQTVPIQIMGVISEAFESINTNLRDIMLIDSEQERKSKEDELAASRTVITNYSTQFKAISVSDQDAALYAQFVDARAKYAEYVDNLISLAKENKFDEYKTMLFSDGMQAAYTSEQNIIKQICDLSLTEAKAKSDGNSQSANNAILSMILVICGGAVLSIVLGVIISRSISNPIKKLVTVADKIADGNLDVTVAEGSKDEVGILARSLEKMSDTLNEFMADINSAAEQVASGSKQVSDSSIALSQGATEQASSIEQLTASIEEISSQTKLNEENAKQVNILGEAAKSKAIQGDSQMLAMNKAMEEINVSSANISKIIKVIDDIAFQTNILALNAAVEAARAGQYGRGFAVVAEEVRSLAARSAAAAKETNEMIVSSISKVEAGTKLAKETAVGLKEIVEAAAKVANLAENVAIASNGQSLGIEQVNQGVKQVSQVVQTNSATSEEAAAASEELSGQAELLKERVSFFKLKKSGRGVNNYNVLKDINPDVLKMLQNSKVKNNDAQTSEAKKHIVLSDSELGKY